MWKLQPSSTNTGDEAGDYFFCANILEEHAQWRDKTKGLSKRVIVKHCVSCQEEEARRLTRLGSIKEIGF